MNIAFLVRGRAQSEEAQMAFMYCCTGPEDPVYIKREAIHRALKEGMNVLKVDSVQSSTAFVEKNGVQQYCFIISGMPHKASIGAFEVSRINEES